MYTAYGVIAVILIVALIVGPLCVALLRHHIRISEIKADIELESIRTIALRTRSID